MKKLIITFAGIMFTLSLFAQTWKAPIYGTSGKPTIKTLKLKPEMKITIGTLTFDSDSLKTDTYYTGTFLGVAGDSLKINLTEVTMNRIFESGTRERKIIPSKNYLINSLPQTDATNVALSDIDVLKYQPKTKEMLSGLEDYVLLGSLAVLVVSPFFCYNYSNQTFNQDQYQYWALGCTVGIVTGAVLQMMGSPKRIQFKEGWPEKKSKTWSFKLKIN